MVSGVPRKAIVTSEEIREALAGPLEAILNCIKNAIERCDPELVSDLVDNGMVMTGGGALLRGIDTYLSEQLNVPVRIADEPLTTVARGSVICLDHLADWRDSLDTGDDL
jgi:rod shape-determining protein MreB